MQFFVYKIFSNITVRLLKLDFYLVIPILFLPMMKKNDYVIGDDHDLVLSVLLPLAPSIEI